MATDSEQDERVCAVCGRDEFEHEAELMLCIGCNRRLCEECYGDTWLLLCGDCLDEEEEELWK